MAVFGGSGGTDAVFFSKLVKIYVKRRLFSFLTYVLRLKPSLKITDYMKVAKLPLPPPPPQLNKEYFVFHLHNMNCIYSVILLLFFCLCSACLNIGRDKARYTSPSS